MLLRAIDRYFSAEALGGILLFLAAAAAFVVANSPLANAYDAFLTGKLTVSLGGWGLSKPLLLWINDGLMAIFFFLIGLELKREILEGRLKNPRDVVLPGVAAAGGMAVPALVFLAFNGGDPVAATGWAIPAATDIAFALGVLALLGDRVPAQLKVFLLTLAILDDMGAIAIIALFYTADLSLWHLALAAVPVALMAALNQARVHRVAPILILGTILWVLVLKSGVHATLAGALTAFFVPLKDRWGKSPLHALEHALSPYVLYLIVPLFAFANAGVSLSGIGLDTLLSPLPLGIALGLIVGKQVGVFAFTYLLVRLRLARLPHGLGWAHIYGAAALAGIGFTMSLFIGGLSYADPRMMDAVRIGVLSGSLVSAVIGVAVLARTLPRRDAAEPAEAQG